MLKITTKVCLDVYQLLTLINPCVYIWKQHFHGSSVHHWRYIPAQGQSATINFYFTASQLLQNSVKHFHCIFLTVRSRALTTSKLLDCQQMNSNGFDNQFIFKHYQIWLSKNVFVFVSLPGLL